MNKRLNQRILPGLINDRIGQLGLDNPLNIPIFNKMFPANKLPPTHFTHRNIFQRLLFNGFVILMTYQMSWRRLINRTCRARLEELTAVSIVNSTRKAAVFCGIGAFWTRGQVLWGCGGGWGLDYHEGLGFELA